MNINKNNILLIITFFFLSANFYAQSKKIENINNTHPNLILTQKGVEKIRAELGKVPLFDATLLKVT